MLIATRLELIIISIIFLSIACFSLNENFVYAQNSNQSFDSAADGLKLQYPSDWKRMETFSNQIVVLAPQLNTDVLLELFNISTAVGDLNQIAESYMYTNDTNRILQSMDVALNGKSAHLVLHAHDVGKVLGRTMILSVMDDLNNRAIIYRYDAPEFYYDTFLSAVGQIIESTEFTKIGGNVFSNDSNSFMTGYNAGQSLTPPLNESNGQQPTANNTYALTSSNLTPTPTSDQLEMGVEIHNLTHTWYDNSYYGIKLLAPGNWTTGEANSSYPLVTFYSPDEDNTATIQVFVENISAPDRSKDINVYLGESINGYSNAFSDFKVKSSRSDASFAENKGYILEGSYSYPTYGQQHMKEYGTVIGNTDYTMNYISNEASYDHYLPIFEGMVKSFKIASKSN